MRGRGHQIKTMIRLVKALDSAEAKTVIELAEAAGMRKRQTYRWLEAACGELDIEVSGYGTPQDPNRYRLKKWLA